MVFTCKYTLDTPQIFLPSFFGSILTLTYNIINTKSDQVKIYRYSTMYHHTSSHHHIQPFCNTIKVPILIAIGEFKLIDTFPYIHDLDSVSFLSLSFVK